MNKIALSTDYHPSVPAYGANGKVIGRTVTRDGGSTWHYEPAATTWPEYQHRIVDPTAPVLDPKAPRDIPRDAAGTPLLPCVPPKCVPPVSQAKSWSSREWIFHSRERARATYAGPIYDQRELTVYAQFLGTDMLGAVKG